MKIGLIVAMDKEYDSLSGVFGDFTQHDIVLRKSGIGKVNAALGAASLIAEHHPDLVISSGCAGGADTRLSVGDVVVGTTYNYHDVYCGPNCAYGQFVGDPVAYTAPEDLVAKAQRVQGAHVVAGRIVTGDWFVDSRDKMRDILTHFPDATAVDMESCALAHTCYKAGVPFVSFRVVSDVPLADHKASQYFDFWERLAESSFFVTREFLSLL